MNQTCPLCHSEASRFFTDRKTGAAYFHCSICDLRFLDRASRLSAEEEKRQYELHNNDVSDIRYQNFVKPLFDLVVSRLNARACGLEFGSGTGPVLTHLFENAGFEMAQYDVFFHPDSGQLRTQYDFVVSSEVLEHLFDPATELQRIKNLLRPGGLFGVMTLLYHDKIDFESWFYRRDPTHVCFYSTQSFEWIKTHYDFNALFTNHERLILLSG